MSQPVVQPGTYRIQISSRGDKALLTVGKSTVVGEGLLVQCQPQAATDDATQQWNVKFNGESRTYTFQSVSTGQYLVNEYPCAAYSNIRLSAKAQQWELYHDDKSPVNVLWMRVPQTTWTVHLCDNAPQNHRMVMYAQFPYTNPEQDCIFDLVSNNISTTIYKPIVSNPVILPGTYRIRSLSTKNLMTLQTSPEPNITGFADICVVARPETVDDPYQQWTIRYIPLSRSFYLQNVATKQYLTSRSPSTAYAKIIPSDQPQHWDIRQAEFDSPAKGLYAIHIPETNDLLDIEGNNPRSGQQGSGIIIYTRPYPMLVQERWMFEPISYATGASNIGRPPVLVSPLLQGVYKIRNVGTNNLVTLPTTIKSPTVDNGINLVSSPESSDTDALLYQQWIVSYEPKSQTYFIENMKTGSFATSVYFESGGYILQGGDKPQLWDIRQMEYDGQPETQLLIKLPATSWIFSVWDNNPRPDTRLGLYPRMGNPADVRQRFIFEPVVNPSRRPDPINMTGPNMFGSCVIRNVMRNMALDIADGGNGKVTGNDADGSFSQRWLVTPILNAPNNFSLQNLESGMYITTVDALVDGGSVMAMSPNPVAWKLEPFKETVNMYRILVPDTQWCLDLDNRGLVDRDILVQLWSSHDGVNQKWAIEFPSV